MYLLDTNVISKLRKVDGGKANPHVKTWAESADARSFFISAITVQELELGTLLVERRDPHQGVMLRAWLDKKILAEFAGRILPVDAEVARRSAALHVPNPKPYRDALIAATALVHGMTVVTRNTADFESTGVALINPWQ
jgi:hypothetical protein